MFWGGVSVVSVKLRIRKLRFKGRLPMASEIRIMFGDPRNKVEKSGLISLRVTFAPSKKDSASYHGRNLRICSFLNKE